MLTDEYQLTNEITTHEVRQMAKAEKIAATAEKFALAILSAPGTDLEDTKVVSQAFKLASQFEKKAERLAEKEAGGGKSSKKASKKEKDEDDEEEDEEEETPKKKKGKEKEKKKDKKSKKEEPEEDDDDEDDDDEDEDDDD